MGELAERLDSMRVRVSVPNGSIAAELRGRDDVHIRFAPGYYARTDRHDLETQLVNVGKLLWAARTREYDAILTEVYQQPMAGEDPPVTERDVAYRQARDELVATGHCPDRRILLAVKGMRLWKVQIADDAIRGLTEHEFTTRVGEAAAMLIRDQQLKIRQLKQQIFNPPFAEEGRRQ